MTFVSLASFVVSVLLSGLMALAQTPSPPADEHANFPPGPARDLTIRVCSQCHTPDIVAEQQNDLDGWKTVVDDMASKGAQGSDEELDQIVHYLATAFPVPK